MRCRSRGSGSAVPARATSRTWADGCPRWGGTRVCATMLRSRRSRREVSLSAQPHDRVADRDDGTDPEQEALLADSVGLALLVVLDTLTPAERLAFWLAAPFA